MKGQRLIVATDLSENARPAARAGQAMAQVLGLEAVVCHVLDLNQRGSKDKIEVFQDEKLRQKAIDRVAQWYEEVTGKAPADVTIRIGDPAAQIRAIGQEDGTAAVVIAMSGRGAWSKLIFGSTAMKIVGRPTVPTAVIHPDVDHFRDDMTIAVGTDFSPASDGALRQACDIARLTNSTLQIVHVNVLPSTTVINEGDLPPGTQTTEVVEWAKTAMAEFLSRHEELLASVDVHTRVIADHPVAGLRNFVDAKGVDWVVLGDRRPDRQRGASSVKGKWVQQMNCSTLVVPRAPSS